MTRFIGQPENLHWLWLVLVVVAVCLWGEVRRRAGWRAFRGTPADGDVRTRWMPLSTVRAVIDVTLLTMLVLALADPRWGESSQRVPKLGTQVVFLLDVSRSMLAEDVSPSRWERAKSCINDQLSTLGGEPAALVAFAGSATTAVPLTRDYERIRRALHDLTPGNVAPGGTRLGPALEAAAECVVNSLGGDKFVVMVTDGEDHGAGAAEMAARLRRDQQIRCIVIGVGDSEVGGRIPVRSASQTRDETEYVEYNGAVVWSKLNVSLLSEIAEAGGGPFVAVTPTSPGGMTAGNSLTRLMSSSDRAMQSASLPVARFQWLLAVAVGLFLFDAFVLRNLPTVSLVPSRRSAFDAGNRTPLHAALLLGAFVIGTHAAETTAGGPRHVFDAAATAVRERRFGDALAAYRQASELLPERPEPVFNRGVVHYRRGKWAAAQKDFTQVLKTADPRLRSMARYNLGNCLYAEVVDGGLTMPESIDRLWKAIGHYRAALRERPEWADPRVNIELAYAMIRRLEQTTAAPKVSPQQERDDRRSLGNGTQNDRNMQNSPPGGSSQGDLEGDRSPEDRRRGEPDQKGGSLHGRTPEAGAQTAGPAGAEADELGATIDTTGPTDDVHLSRAEAAALLAEIRSRDRRRQRQNAQTNRPAALTVDKDW